jgi:hypothetical protein
LSEFSVSYHLHTGDDSRAAQATLRQAKLSGIIFGPANGWLTFVPYAQSKQYRMAGGPRFADYLSGRTRLTTLRYCYAEDHGWTFALARPNQPLVQFACWWDPSPTIERDKFDPLALAPFLAPELVEPLLRLMDHNEAADAQPAYRFAELLGLPVYKWLSPELAQNNTNEFLERGGRKLGTKPPGVAVRLQPPPNRQIALPQPYLSARQALDVFAPFMAKFKAPWSLTMLSTYGILLADGRAVWQARWRYGDTGDMIQAALFQDGRLSFRANTAPAYALDYLMTAINLPENWLDSTDIALIVARMPVPGGFAGSLGSMTLRSYKDYPSVWEILSPGDSNSDKPYASWTIYLDAASGDVLAEFLGRKHGAQIVSVRRRLQGGDWEDYRPGEPLG